MKAVICVLLLISIAKADGIFDIYAKQINDIPAITYPEGQREYLKDITLKSNYTVDTFPTNELSKKVEKYDFDQETKELMKVINADGDMYILNQTFIEDNDLYSNYGIVTFKDGNVNIVFINIVLTGELEPLFLAQEIEKCDRNFLFFKKCRKVQVNVPRGYTKDEMNMVNQQLVAVADDCLRKLLRKPVTSEHLTVQKAFDYQFVIQNTDLISESNIYHDQFQKNYENIVNSVRVQIFNRIDELLVVNFIKQIISIEKFENEAEFIQVYETKLKEICYKIVEKNLSDNSSEFFSDIVRFAFQHKGVIYFYDIKITHNEKTKEFSFYIRSLNAAISFFEDFMIFKTSNQITYDLGFDKNELLLVFEAIVVAKIKNPKSQFNKDINISNKTNIRETLSKALTQAKSANKKNIRSTHNGFESLTNAKIDKFYESSKFTHFNKLSGEGFSTYVEVMARKLGMDDNDIEEVVKSCLLARDEDVNEWNAYHIVYNNKLASFVISKNENNTYNVYLVTVDEPIDTYTIGLAIRKQNLKSTDNTLLVSASLYEGNDLITVFDFMNALVVRKVYETILN
jgi:hypothetical protein